MKLFFLGLISLSLLGACISIDHSISTTHELKNSEYLIVGSVILEPPLAKDEQSLYSTFVPFAKNYIFLITKQAAALSHPKAGRTDLSDSIKVKLGNVFLIREYREVLTLYGGLILMNARAAGGPEYARLKFDLKIKHPTGAHAIYIGRIINHRDDFMQTKSIDIENDFTTAQKEYRAVAGADSDLQVSLALK